VRNHIFKIEYNGKKLDIVCPGYNIADGTYVVVIPWYLAPGRRYPIQVYQFACSYYSANLQIGQRGAAEATRAKFKLKTFSHSTVSRTFRLYEQAQKAALKARFGGELKISGAEGLVVVCAVPKDAENEEKCSATMETPPSKWRFPSVTDTASRREAIAGFLPMFEKDAKTADIVAAVRQFVRSWHEKYRRLLF
jgi:hypothetical protein